MLPMPRALLALLLTCVSAIAEMPALIPMPREIRETQGTFKFGPEIRIRAERPSDAARFIAVIKDAGLKPIRATDTADIVIRRGDVKNPHGFPGAYRAEASADGLLITTPDDAGAIHAAETLRQWIHLSGSGASITCATIEDWPAYPVRGFMLDTGRNYQSPELVKEQIEVMARYKLNVFHFHFTDNPGWRLESKVHPKATGSMTRNPGKYYTHREFRDLVKFCRERGITLIPEMDMPGHSASFRKSLGITSMNSPEASKILKDLLTELASLATPEEMPYIHIGTDEVRGKEEQVDATFLPEMSDHVRSLGREVIGWRQGL